MCCAPPTPPPAAGDVGLMADLLKDLEDPETLKEVEKLMNVILLSFWALSYGRGQSM